MDGYRVQNAKFIFIISFYHCLASSAFHSAANLLTGEQYSNSITKSYYIYGGREKSISQYLVKLLFEYFPLKNGYLCAVIRAFRAIIIPNN